MTTKIQKVIFEETIATFITPLCAYKPKIVLIFSNTCLIFISKPFATSSYTRNAGVLLGAERRLSEDLINQISMKTNDLSCKSII